MTKSKLLKSSKTQTGRKLTNWNCANSKNQTVTKLKNFNSETIKHSNCDNTHKFKLWQNSTQIVRRKKLKSNQIKKNSNWDNNSNCEKVKLKLWQPKNLNSDKSISDKTYNSLLVRTTWHLNNRWDVLWPSFCNLTIFFMLMRFL